MDVASVVVVVVVVALPEVDDDNNTEARGEEDDDDATVGNVVVRNKCTMKEIDLTCDAINAINVV